MFPLPDLNVYAGLITLFLVSLPLGATIVRLGERFVGRRVALSVVERLLISFYATGGLLFVLASIPLPLYGESGVVALLSIGGIAYTVLAARDRAGGPRTVVRFVASPTGIFLGLGSLGLLAIEVIGGRLVLPNGIDGAAISLFVNRLLALHTVPWTLQPYAAAGVVYPQGATVWFSLPVLLFGWPILVSPVALPPLFLSLTPAAAFCLGERLRWADRLRLPWMGLLFAGFFGLLASWPRLYVGGSYDFILGLPLFLLLLGFVRPFVSCLQPWRMAVAFGVLLGATAAISVTVGTALALLLLGYWIVSSLGVRPALGSRLARVLATLGIMSLFLMRSFVGILVWWNYPGHVMTPNSVPPYSPLAFRETYTGVVGQIDPFTPWKWKVSPFPVLSLELQVLLALGIALSVVLLSRRREGLRQYLPVELVEVGLVGTAVLLVVTIAVGLLGQWNTSLSGIQSVTNLWELSILLFTFYSLIALVPLVAGGEYLWAHRHQRPKESPPFFARGSSTTRWLARYRPPHRHRWPMVAAVAVLLIPLGSGLGVTVTSLPEYLHNYLLGQSNGTEDDLTVLEWASTHLPSCSEVLVAPGSAAQFLPEYATVRMIYPAFPVPANLTYYDVVQNLSNGVYGPATRAGMLALGVTEVFVTGATTNTYPPFLVAPLRASPDFTLLTSSGDAFLFEFSLGVTMQGCPPS